MVEIVAVMQIKEDRLVEGVGSGKWSILNTFLEVKPIGFSDRWNMGCNT